MYHRCHNPNDQSYKNYGARGIRVHLEWRDDYLAFASYVRNVIGEKPNSNYSIDRIDNDGDYAPGNLRWATRKQQLKNSRLNPNLPRRPTLYETAMQFVVNP